jgi:hypothetical protein
MARRAYFATMTGTGTSTSGTVTDRIRPANFDGIVYDGYALPASGVGFILADVTSAQHTTLLGTAGVTYLPIEDASGNIIDPSGTFGDVSAANRSTVKTRMEAQGVPTQDFGLGDLIRRAFKVVKRRYNLKQLLGADDFTEGLDTLVSAIAAPKRSAIATKLAARGFDTSVIVGTDTVREAVRKLIAQDVAVLRTGDE